MAVLELRFDPQSRSLRGLTPVDGEFAFAIVDVFYRLCAADEGSALFHYEAEIDLVLYRSPLKVIATFKNISVRTAKAILEKVLKVLKVLYYEEEKRRRILANRSLEQDVIRKTLKNLAATDKLRKQLIKDGIAPDQAAQQLAKLLSDEPIVLQVRGPTEEP